MPKDHSTDAEIAAFIDKIDHPTRRADAHALDALFREVTGWKPVLWGSIIGYGSYHYIYDSGREGDSLATGFSPRKANQSIYIMPGYQDYSAILDRIGKYKMGKACLYVNKLTDVDQDVLAELIRKGLDDLDKMWPVRPS